MDINNIITAITPYTGYYTYRSSNVYCDQSNSILRGEVRK